MLKWDKLIKLVNLNLTDFLYKVTLIHRALVNFIFTPDWLYQTCMSLIHHLERRHWSPKSVEGTHVFSSFPLSTSKRSRDASKSSLFLSSFPIQCQFTPTRSLSTHINLDSLHEASTSSYIILTPWTDLNEWQHRHLSPLIWLQNKRKLMYLLLNEEIFKM